jgi:transposase
LRGFERRKPARRTVPKHLPREVYPAAAGWPFCGGALHNIGEHAAETLELIPRQWKMIRIHPLYPARASRFAIERDINGRSAWRCAARGADRPSSSSRLWLRE